MSASIYAAGRKARAVDEMAKLEEHNAYYSLENITVTDWADQIRPHLAGAVGHIVAAGKKLIEAKENLPHGQFGVLLGEIGLTPRTAQKFMAIARHPLIANATPGSHLPATWTVLFELSKIPADLLAVAIEEGRVRPSLTRGEAQQVVASTVLNPKASNLEGLAAAMTLALTEAEIQDVQDTDQTDPLFAAAAEWMPKLAERLSDLEHFQPTSDEERAVLIHSYAVAAAAAEDVTRRVAERRLRYQRRAGEILCEMRRLVKEQPPTPERDEIASDLLRAAAMVLDEDTFPLPIFPNVTGEEEEMMRDSIRRFGVLVPIVVDQHGRVIDGYQRKRLADELGETYRVDVMKVQDDMEALSIAMSLNGFRQHLAPDQGAAIAVDLEATP